MNKKEFELGRLYALTCEDDGRIPQDRDKAEEKYNKEHPALYPKILNTIYYTTANKNTA